MIRYLGEAGVTKFSDHEDIDEADDDVIQDCIEQASDELTGFLRKRYDETALSADRQVERWATVLACYYLTERRGNPVPDSLALEYEKLMGQDGLVRQAMNGTYYLPCSERRNINTPAFSNMTVDRRYAREKVRVIPNNSSPVVSKLEQDRVSEIVID